MLGDLGGDVDLRAEAVHARVGRVRLDGGAAAAAEAGQEEEEATMRESNNRTQAQRAVI